MGPRRTKRQRAAAAVITADARCTPVLVRAAIVGRARMPRAALEITAPNGEVLGHVALAEHSDGLDLQQRFWLVGDPTPGAVVALVSEGGRQVILPGGRLRAGPARPRSGRAWRAACSGGSGRRSGHEETSAFHAVFAQDRATVDGPAFARAVSRFRFAAVTVPMIFFCFCFPYLFVIPFAGAQRARPRCSCSPRRVVGGTLMTLWSAQCRREVGRRGRADRARRGGARQGDRLHPVVLGVDAQAAGAVGRPAAHAAV